MSQLPLETKRLVLRPFYETDALKVKSLAGDKRIADVTAHIPHPYPEGLAEKWISDHALKWAKAELASFAIILKESDLLIGCVSLKNITKSEGELGFWVGTEYWNKGFCTEACCSVVDFGFNYFELNRIYAHHLTRNPASGKVLVKSGLINIGSGESVCGYRNINESVELYEIFTT